VINGDSPDRQTLGKSVLYTTIDYRGKTVSDGGHTVKLYQNGVYIGEAYYGGILMPQQ